MYEIWSGLELVFIENSFEMAQKYVECGSDDWWLT